MSDIRMDAYYYGFDKTNVDCVDELLSCIACAGKSFHHTSDWGDAATTYGEQTVGETPVDWIQNSAIRVANEIQRLQFIIKEMQQVDDVLATKNEIDAKRYRWIRKSTSPVHLVWYGNKNLLDYQNNLSEQHLDSAIDEAMTK